MRNSKVRSERCFPLLYHYYFLPLLLVFQIKSIFYMCTLYSAPIWTNHISHHIHTSDNNPIRFINSLRIWIKVHRNCFFRVLLPFLSLKIDINWLRITSTTPSCSGSIPPQKSWANSVLGVVFSYTMPKMVFHYSHRFSWEKTL